MEYLVKLGWRCEFLFDDLLDAAAFAKAAFMTRTGDEVGEEIQIIIREIKEEEEEDDETN